MRDYILKLNVDDRQMIDRTDLKRHIYRTLDDNERMCLDGTPKYQFSLEPLLPASNWVRLRVLNGIDERKLDGIARPLPIVIPKNEDKIALTVWVAPKPRKICIPPGRPRDDRSVYQRGIDAIQTFESRFAPFMSIDSFSILDEPQKAKLRSEGLFIAIGARISVIGTLQNTEKLLLMMHQGVGASRGYGFGLVTVTVLHRGI